MPKQNVPLLSFNRGLVSPKGLARVDVDRTRLSASRMENWLPKSLGPMTIRPGTKYLGSSKNDTGAEYIEFVAAENETALIELTNGIMRVWVDDALITRPSVATTFDDFGDTSLWEGTGSSGGGAISFNDTGMVLNGTNIGGIARATRKVALSDTGAINVEHALAIHIKRGPVTFRCGDDTGADNYISETTLFTGRHSLAFTPTAAEFHLTFQNAKDIEKHVGSVEIENDTGTPAAVMELVTPWTANDLDNIRYDQSADVVFVACDDVRQQRIERRGTGRSWSVVDYRPDNGPFIPGRSAPIRLKVGATFGNTTLTADQKFFKSTQIGSIFRLFHSGQSGVYRFSRDDVYSDVWTVTGIGPGTERLSSIVTTGFTADTGNCDLRVQRSFDGEFEGFRTVATIRSNTTTNVSDTGDNLTVWYRLAIPTGDYDAGTPNAAVTYGGGGKTGICRVTSIQSETVANVEVLERFSSTDWSEDWNEGRWSDRRGYPTSVQLFEGRLFWGGGSEIFGSVSDDYHNFDDETEGDAAPISRTIGRGPVSKVTFMASALRLLLGTSSSVLTVRSSGFDEPLTQSNANAKPSETKGAANLRALLIDTRAVFVHRSGQRLYSLGYDSQAGDYVETDFTKLVPDLLEAGVISIAVQTFPDVRVHCVLADGTVALLTYDEAEEILCWSTWRTNGFVERAMVLPGADEDAIYYLIRRTINGHTKRYLERWASETECVGGTLTWLADSAIEITGPTSIVTAAHLAGEECIVWADGASQSPVNNDLSQTKFTSDTGAGQFNASGTITSGIVGLPYQGDQVSTKLAYGAAVGTALNQPKRVDHVGFILYKTHNNGLFFGSDSGNLNPLPRQFKGADVDPTLIHQSYDVASHPFPGKFDTDARIHLRCYAPHPVTVMAATPSVDTNDKA